MKYKLFGAEKYQARIWSFRMTVNVFISIRFNNLMLFRRLASFLILRGTGLPGKFMLHLRSNVFRSVRSHGRCACSPRKFPKIKIRFCSTIKLHDCVCSLIPTSLFLFYQKFTNSSEPVCIWVAHMSNRLTLQKQKVEESEKVVYIIF